MCGLKERRIIQDTSQELKKLEIKKIKTETEKKENSVSGKQYHLYIFQNHQFLKWKLFIKGWSWYVNKRLK